ncbi:MAG: hypothetical protein JWM05_744, partial [Acidimicrobiales bacterium]|nr:hypothetical protein [Acidimicrobiales bacterium]
MDPHRRGGGPCASGPGHACASGRTGGEYAPQPVVAPSRRRWLPRLLGVLVVLLVASGCQVRTDVEVAVQPDGSGAVTVMVTLDREAASRIPDLREQLRTADLRAAGWTVTGPTTRPGGGLQVSARKPFARAADAAKVLGELSGPSGPFRGFVVERKRSFATTSYTVRGSLDLSKGVAVFGDAALTRSLGGLPFGRSPDELRLLAGGSVAKAAPFTLRVMLPGGGGRTYQARLGEPAVVVDSHGSVNDTRAWVLLVGGIFAALLAVLVFIDARRRPNRRLRRPSERGTGIYERRPYQTIDQVDEGQVPGVGGRPTAVRVRGDEPPPDPKEPAAPAPAPSAGPPAGSGPRRDPGHRAPRPGPPAPRRPGARPGDAPRRPGPPGGGPGGPRRPPGPAPAPGHGPSAPR